MLHVILCVGPSKIRNSVSTAPRNDMLETLLELVENATSKSMLEMLLHAAEPKMKGQDHETVLEQITSYFYCANLPQKRLML